MTDRKRLKEIVDDCRAAAQVYAGKPVGQVFSGEHVANIYLRIADRVDAARLAISSKEVGNG